MPNSSNITVASDAPRSEELEPGKLYALRTESGDYGSKNWAFFVPDPKVSPIGVSGTIFHIADQNSEGSIGSWKLIIEEQDILSFPTSIAIMENIQVLDLALPLKELEPEKLYALLTYRGELGLWNWSFFVPDPSVFPIGSAGTIFHVVDSDLVGSWKFEAKKQDVISSSPLVVAIIRLADIGALGEYGDILGKDTLLSMLKTVPVPTHASTDFSSQAWLMEAIRVLHDFGVVHCDYPDLLKREIRRLGFDAMANFLENKGRIGLDILFKNRVID